MNDFKQLMYIASIILLLGACASSKPIYRGQVINGVPHGIGKKFWPDGSQYQGQWFNGTMSGNGVLTWPDSKMRYEGAFANGKRDGQGKMAYADGGSYQGAWQQGARSGRGLMIFADKSRYDGNWLSDMQHGNGTQELSNGNYFKGVFASGQRHGDSAAIAYYYPANKAWCIDDCTQSSPQFAIISGYFSGSNVASPIITPCGSAQENCKAMIAPALVFLAAEHKRKLAEAEQEKDRLAAEAEKEKTRKEMEAIAAAKRKEEARIAFLETGTANQIYILADRLETDRDYVQSSEAYRTVVSRFPESTFTPAAMTRLGAMRDKRDQQEAEERRLAIEVGVRKNTELQRKREAEEQRAERKAERDADNEQRSADRASAERQQQKSTSGSSCVRAAEAVCDKTTSGLGNIACKALAGAGCG